MNEVVLLILFNHKYESNLERLRQIYVGRFSNVYFIMPFYTGVDKDVICVYGNSFFFQSYIAQALQRIKKDEFKHYIIIGDDLLLNPAINEKNYQSEFNLGTDTGFIPEIFMLGNYKEKPRLMMSGFDKWVWNYNALSFNYKNQSGIEVEKELPTEEEALKAIASHGYSFNPLLNKNQFIDSAPQVRNIFQMKNIFANVRIIMFWLKNYINFSLKNKRTLKYPMAGSYSDIVIIPAASVSFFTHFIGVFGALNLFVEIAIPTALMLSTKDITQEKDLRKKGNTFWGNEEFQAIKDKYNSNLENLFTHFPDDVLYIHPVKLSQWK